MNDATPGAVDTVSDSGCTYNSIFRQYLTDHFLKHVPGRNNDNIHLLLDWHKSHVAVDIIEWEQEHIIINTLQLLPHTYNNLWMLDVMGLSNVFKIMNFTQPCDKTRQS